MLRLLKKLSKKEIVGTIKEWEKGNNRINWTIKKIVQISIKKNPIQLILNKTSKVDLLGRIVTNRTKVLTILKTMLKKSSHKKMMMRILKSKMEIMCKKPMKLMKMVMS